MTNPDKPLFRPLTWDEASAISPWPNRISGKTEWKKTVRDIDAVLEEYDRGWYAETLAGWRSFLAESGASGKLPIAAVVEYQRAVFARTLEGITKNPQVYGNVAETGYLVSAGSQLYAMEFVAASELHYRMVADHLIANVREAGVRTLVELGCGDGMNLVRTVAAGAVEHAFGGEVCANARTLLGEMAAATGKSLTPFAFDFRRSDHLKELALPDGPWALTTVHAVEQLADGAGPLVEAVLSLPRKPARVIHLEPVQFPEAAGESPLAASCRKYAAINRYNSDVLAILEKHQAAGRLTIRTIRPRMFGLSAFNPTTLISWEPK